MNDKEKMQLSALRSAVVGILQLIDALCMNDKPQEEGEIEFEGMGQ